MPGTSTGQSGVRQPLWWALVSAGACLLVVGVATSWSRHRDPDLSTAAFVQPVTVEAVVVGIGETRSGGGGTACRPTYRFEFDGTPREATSGVERTTLCASLGTELDVTIDATDPTRVVVPALERSLALGEVGAVALGLGLLGAGLLIRRRTRRVQQR